MKRLFILAFSTLVATMLYAQQPQSRLPYLEYYGVPSFTHAKYNDCHQNTVLNMRASAKLLIEGMKKLEGNTQTGTFTVKIDPDSVYDGSYKIYAAQFTNFSVEYTTYCLADQLSITLNHKKYTLSCLDGGMDVHIKMAQKYKRTQNGEQLCIKITENIPLAAADKSEIILKKGSTCCFNIIDTRHK